VSRGLRSLGPGVPTAYKLISPDDAAHGLGAISLDEAWRNARPELLDLIIVGLALYRSGLSEERSCGVNLNVRRKGG